MRQVRTFAVIAAFTMSAIVSAHAGDPRTFTVDEPFYGVHAARGVTVNVAMGDEPLVRVKVSDDNFEEVEVDVVDDGLLFIARRDKIGDSGRRRIEAFVTLTELQRLKVSTGAKLDGADLRAEALEITINTGGEMEISGACGDADIKVSTGGVLKARDMICRTAKAKGRTGGEVKIHASESARGYARMGAEITFYGNPTLTDKGEFLGGDVRTKK